MHLLYLALSPVSLSMCEDLIFYSALSFVSLSGAELCFIFPPHLNPLPGGERDRVRGAFQPVNLILFIDKKLLTTNY